MVDNNEFVCDQKHGMNSYHNNRDFSCPIWEEMFPAVSDEDFYEASILMKMEIGEFTVLGEKFEDPFQDSDDDDDADHFNPVEDVSKEDEFRMDNATNPYLRAYRIGMKARTKRLPLNRNVYKTEKLPIYTTPSNQFQKSIPSQGTGTYNGNIATSATGVQGDDSSAVSKTLKIVREVLENSISRKKQRIHGQGKERLCMCATTVAKYNMNETVKPYGYSLDGQNCSIALVTPENSASRQVIHKSSFNYLSNDLCYPLQESLHKWIPDPYEQRHSFQETIDTEGQILNSADVNLQCRFEKEDSRSCTFDISKIQRHLNNSQLNYPIITTSPHKDEAIDSAHSDQNTNKPKSSIYVVADHCQRQCNENKIITAVFSGTSSLGRSNHSTNAFTSRNSSRNTLHASNTRIQSTVAASPDSVVEGDQDNSETETVVNCTIKSKQVLPSACINHILVHPTMTAKFPSSWIALLEEWERNHLEQHTIPGSHSHWSIADQQRFSKRYRGIKIIRKLATGLSIRLHTMAILLDIERRHETCSNHLLSLEKLDATIPRRRRFNFKT
jgi:hypothetical protein